MMTSRRRSALLLIRITSDISAVLAAWVLAYLIRFYSGLPIFKGIPDPSLYLKLVPFIGAIWLIVFSAAGFYHRSLRKRSAFIEGIDIFQSCILASLGFIAFTYFYEEYRYSRLMLAIFALLHPWLIIAGRSAIRKALRIYRRNSPPRGLLIIGSGDLLDIALRLAGQSDFEQSPIIGILPAGGSRDSVAEYCTRRGIPCISQPENWTDFISKNNVHSVYFAVPHAAYDYVDKNLVEISEQVLDIRIIPDLIRYSKFGAGIDLVHGVPLINLHDSPLEGIGAIVKRLFDLFVASTMLIAAAPIMLALALLVRLSSAGPILYRQERMGMDGRTFDCFKFRSMPVNAEDSSGPVWAKQGENRATLIGSIMRKYSLDELPQLLNVLRGEMSLVGPRPERPVFVEEFRQNIPGYMLRHKVKAGLTGWAQVNGWRGNTSIEKRIEFDLFYIQNWSLWLDLRIMSMTVAEVFFSRNAY